MMDEKKTTELASIAVTKTTRAEVNELRKELKLKTAEALIKKLVADFKEQRK